MHCSLIMHGFHNGKWLVLCSNVRQITSDVFSLFRIRLSSRVFSPVRRILGYPSPLVHYSGKRCSYLTVGFFYRDPLQT